MAHHHIRRHLAQASAVLSATTLGTIGATAAGDSVMEIIDSHAGPDDVFAWAVNRDCSAMVLRWNDEFSVWREDEGPTFIGTTNDFGTPPRSVNKDGTVAGIPAQPASLWISGQGIIELDHLGDCTSGSPLVLMADDGGVVVRTCTNDCDSSDPAAYYRSSDGRVTEFETGQEDCEPPLFILRVYALTADGHTAHGRIFSTPNGDDGAARWVDGVYEFLGGEAIYAGDDSGNVVAGGIGSNAFVREGGAETAINAPTNIRPKWVTRNKTVLAGSAADTWGLDVNNTWTPNEGWRSPTQFITEEYGVDFGALGWSGVEIIRVSDDDSVLVGSGFDPMAIRHTFRICRSGQDTDGDGLDDLWERCGIPYQGGVYKLDLNDDGYTDADYEHKDLFVEVDAMTGFSLSDDSRDALEYAFNNAPVPNPDDCDGVTLHLHRDDTNLPHVAQWEIPHDAADCMPLNWEDVRDQWFGTDEEHNDKNVTALLEAKAKAFRYGVIADSSTSTPPPGEQPENIGGCATDIPGNGFVCFYGGVGDDKQAAIFMHELGHCLGLQHGGGDSTNGKPNYPSIMNYVMAYSYNWNGLFWRLDYSREGHEVFGVLDESALVESDGIGSKESFYGNFKMPFGVNEDSPDKKRVIRYVTLDGTATDFGDPAGTGYQDGNTNSTVAQDLNYVADPPAGIDLPTSPSPGDLLEPYNDWANLMYAVPTTPGPGIPIDEPSIEALEWVDENFPSPPGTGCETDLNDDGATDAADLAIVLGTWGPIGGCPPASPGDADFNDDCIVDPADLAVLLGSWGPC